MKKINIKEDPSKYMTTLQMRGKLPQGTDFSSLQKYRMRGSRKTYYLISDVNSLLESLGLKGCDEPKTKSAPPAQSAPEAKDTSFVPESLTLIAYVDGSYNKLTGVYGSAAIITCDDEILAQKTDHGTKMNSMWNVAGEIAAAAIAVKLAEEFMPDHLIIRYDCEAIEKWPTGQWRIKEGNTYADQYVKFMNKKRAFDISYEHVKAHTGDKYNEMADDMALKAAGIETMESKVPEYTAHDSSINREVLSIKYQVQASCLDAIAQFYTLEKHAFKDYAKLKTGTGDNFSKMWEPHNFEGLLSESAYKYINENLTNKSELMDALRWAARGLRADDAVRKALVDKELFGKKK